MNVINNSESVSITVAVNATRLKNYSSFSWQSQQIVSQSCVITYKNTVTEELLIRAVNNRTRERNYFRLYCQLLEGEITDEEFEKEINEHEDLYVVSNDKDASMNDLITARKLIERIIDVNDSESMMDLFSFNLQSKSF